MEDRPRASPFVVGSMGIADLDLRDDFNSGIRRFSGSLGGVAKIPLSANLGVRFEGRLLDRHPRYPLRR